MRKVDATPHPPFSYHHQMQFTETQTTIWKKPGQTSIPLFNRARSEREDLVNLLNWCFSTSCHMAKKLDAFNWGERRKMHSNSLLKAYLMQFANNPEAKIQGQ